MDVMAPYRFRLFYNNYLSIIGAAYLPCTKVDKHPQVTITLTGSFLVPCLKQLTLLSTSPRSDTIPRRLQAFPHALPDPTDILHYGLAGWAQPSPLRCHARTPMWLVKT